MKRILIIVIVLAAAGGVGFLIYTNLVSECDERYEQYSVFVSSIDQSLLSTDRYYRWEIGEQMVKRQADVAWACLSEEKPARAISMYKLLVESMNKPQYSLDVRLPRSSAQVKLVAVYYGLLAKAYGMQGDDAQQAAALKKQAQYEAEARRYKKQQ